MSNLRMAHEKSLIDNRVSSGDAEDAPSIYEAVNASGHKDQLQRGYGLLGICGLALTVDNAWVAVGTSLAVSIHNGGPPGVIYELLVACFYYTFIAASIAELASAVPSAGGVYHWASLTPGAQKGRVIGFFAGYLNLFGWLFDLASIVFIMAELTVQMYSSYHPGYVISEWNVFVSLICITVICMLVTIFLNKYLPVLQQFGLFMIVAGGLATILVIAVLPEKHSSHKFVWSDFQNQTGWGNGVAFLIGVLNGAFTIGTPDAITHMAEELPNPRRDISRAVAAQIILGSVFAFSFAVSISYGINDLDAVLNSGGAFPLGEVYLQATNRNQAATFGLLFIIFLSLTPCLIGTFLTVGRTFWALARDEATPFASFFSRVNEDLSCPVPATILCGFVTIAFGAISIGSSTAFNDIVGSFVILTTTSYAFAILPHLATGRRNIPKGPFWMGNYGFIVNALALIFITFFNIMFCLPYSLPTSTASMNYNSVILIGVVGFVSLWWLLARKTYKGTRVAGMHASIGG